MVSGTTGEKVAETNVSCPGVSEDSNDIVTESYYDEATKGVDGTVFVVVGEVYHIGTKGLPDDEISARCYHGIMTLAAGVMSKIVDSGEYEAEPCELKEIEDLFMENDGYGYKGRKANDFCRNFNKTLSYDTLHKGVFIP
jgi:hypothetical protein